MFKFSFALAFVFVSFVFGENSLLIKTNDGWVSGEMMSSTCRGWRSIPYASPPIGELRWSPPQPVSPWNNTLYANLDPPGCPQDCYLPPHNCPLKYSEDCLYLNIFSPANNTMLYPVMVFIHGGNFKQGYSGGLLYNGALGFLWSVSGPRGNYGFEDQQLALQWIKSNIEYFNGNPNEITIYGQSAGAVSVALHLMLESSSTLFRYAIMESEPFGLPIRDTKTWGAFPYTFYNYLGCNYSIISSNEIEFWNCLRNKTIKEIKNAQIETENNVLNELPDHFLNLFMPWTPTAGTDLIISQPIWAFENSIERNSNYIIGTVANEGVEFIWMAYPNGITREMVDRILIVMMGPELAVQIREHYPLPDNTSDYRSYMSKIATDGLFRCPSRNASLSHINNYNSNVYYYHFNHPASFNDNAWGVNYTECWGNIVCHGEELIFVFHPNLAPIDSVYLSNENKLGFTMQTYWSQFAHNGYPGIGSDGVNLKWLPFESINEQSIIFETDNIFMASFYDLNQSQCEFWDSTNYSWIK